MGITIAYRGRLADLARIEDFEDRLLDLALEVGGMARIWRSYADETPDRLVRGILLNLAPGMDTTSMLVSPEGWLIGLVDIQEAERGHLTEPPWCFTKTEFGPLEGHVVLVEMLEILQREFLPDLQVSDEGGYYNTHDLAELVRRRAQSQEGIAGLVEGLRRHGLSHEAAEDPDILVRHIERVAARVYRILQRPPEHPPVNFPEEVPGVIDLETTEALWDELFKHNRRQQERLQRAIEERRSQGEEDEDVFENALADIGLDLPQEEPPDEEEPEPLPPLPDESVLEFPEWTETEDVPIPDEEEDHPLLERATDILKQLQTALRGAGPDFSSSVDALLQGAFNTVGGLAQVLSRNRENEAPDDHGLRLVQLKRALRGTAFARAGLLPLRPAVSTEQFDQLLRTLRQLEQDIFQELARLRDELQPGDGE